jgi:hypothetical protein
MAGGLSGPPVVVAGFPLLDGAEAGNPQAKRLTSVSTTDEDLDAGPSGGRGIHSHRLRRNHFLGREATARKLSLSNEGHRPVPDEMGAVQCAAAARQFAIDGRWPANATLTG